MVVATLDAMAHPRSETRDGRPPKSRGRGRFAPSPTGELHFGSVVAAVASFLDARSRGDEWLVRIDDVDAPRVAPGAGAAILRELERLELAWDGEIVHQSARLERYEAALQALHARDLCFPCACTRRETVGRIYPGTCRTGVPPGRQARSVRVRVGDGSCEVEDLVQGKCRQDLGADIGDFIVYRADGIFAYHLTTAVDDAEQGITRVVRGADLLFATLRQVHLQDLLALNRPEYGHVPVATTSSGEKLSKQTRAAPTSARPAPDVARDALTFLGHAPPPDLEGSPPSQLWSWARGEWSLERVPRGASRPSPPGWDSPPQFTDCLLRPPREGSRA